MTDVTSTAAHAAVDIMVRAGVRRLYTVPGESFLEILDAAERCPGLSLISTRHESGASFMAEADAKLTGKPAVAMATRGVGASNLAIGVHTARQDSTPMLALLGQVETPFLGREAFQEVDLAAFYTPITKWSATAHRAGQVAELVERGLRAAISGRPGPAMVAVPADLFGESVPCGRSGEIRPPLCSAGSEEVGLVARRLSGATRPVVIAGGGARGAREELVGFAEKWRVGVYAAFRRQDVFPNNHPLYLGHLTLGTPPQTLRALEGADLVLVIGCRLDEVSTQSYEFPRKDQPVIQVDVDPDCRDEALVSLECALISDPRSALAALAARAPSPGPARDWSVDHQAYLDSSTVPAGESRGGIDPARVVGALREAAPEDALLTNDAGNFSAFVHRYWRYNHPRTQLAPANGAMGYGVPAAVAAKLAAPERCVVACCGDGGFLMSGQEIETAVRYGAPIAVVVFRNGMHGTIAMHQVRKLGRTAGVEIGEVDLAGYARSLGATGYTVRDPDELEPALREALSSESVALVDVVTDPDLISPSARLSEFARSGADVDGRY
jgi:acetolactate synthase I/II/III large subunit